MGYDWTETIGTPVVEDFDDYTETDPSATIGVSGDTITFTDLDRSADARVTYDYGAAYFSGDFVHYFDTTMTAMDSGALATVWALKNTDADDGWCNANERCIVAFWWDNAGDAMLYLREYNGDTTMTSDSVAGIAKDGTVYYCKVKRVTSEGVNGVIYLYIYSDATHETLVDRLVLNLGADTDYRYLQGLSSYAGGDVGTTCTGTNTNMRLTEKTGPLPTIEDQNILEMRTNINLERDDAGLAAYVWTDTTIDGQEVLQTEIAELRTAIDSAYDELLTCAAHYTSDDSTHYTTDKTSHDSSVCGTHYTTHDSAAYSTDDGSDEAGHNATHYITHDGTKNSTHNGAQNSSRKTYYYSGVYSGGLCIFRTYDMEELRRED